MLDFILGNPTKLDKNVDKVVTALRTLQQLQAKADKLNGVQK